MEPSMVPARVTWLVGPPGAGKSTWAGLQTIFSRVVELTDMLGPLVNAVPIRKGVLEANGRLVDLIRAIESRPENAGLPPLLVVAGLVAEGAVLPVHEGEAVLLLLPDRDRWRQQLHLRPVGGGSSGQYDDYAYAERWYDRLGDWSSHPGVLRVATAFREDLLGRSGA